MVTSNIRYIGARQPIEVPSLRDLENFERHIRVPVLLRDLGRAILQLRAHHRLISENSDAMGRPYDPALDFERLSGNLTLLQTSQGNNIEALDRLIEIIDELQLRVLIWPHTTPLRV